MPLINKKDKLLIIVESPNKVKSITEIVKKLGYTQARVAASVGHITKIKDNKKSYKNTGIHPNDDFRVEYIVTEDKEYIVENLSKQVLWADLVLLATDADREGEAISWHLKEELKIPEEKYYRIMYHSITPAAINEALLNPTKIDSALFDAAEARAAVDKLMGYTLTPIARKYLGARSVGRCQSAGLKLIVDRETEINNFKPEKYYEIYLLFKKDNLDYKAKFKQNDTIKKDRLSSLGEVNIINNKCLGGEFVVKEIKSTEKKESAPAPYCTATFQQDAVNKFGMKVKDVMSCAQKLFEGIEINRNHIGLITYIRTDSTVMAPDFLRELEKYNRQTYSDFKAPKVGKKTGNEQEGHECLRVVDPNMTPDKLKNILNDRLLKIYTLIWQRTIASALSSAIIAENTYIIDNNGQLFTFIDQELKVPGFKQVYGQTGKNLVQKFSIGEKIIPCELAQTADKNNSATKLSSGLYSLEKSTQPPGRYTEASLINELQNKGIGRPSTFATIVETILSAQRNYCTLENKKIVPTNKGILLANFLDRAFETIINLNYTKELEAQLDLIAANKIDKKEFLNQFFTELTEAVKNNKEAAPEAEEVLCPNCGATMVVRKNKYGNLFYGCSNYPDCRGIVGFN